jgi:hypothetical protein
MHPHTPGNAGMVFMLYQQGDPNAIEAIEGMVKRTGESKESVLQKLQMLMVGMDTPAEDLKDDSYEQ